MSGAGAALLEGVRVVSLAVNLPGPVAASRLASLGARVVKVEPPTGDPLRSIAASWYAELAQGHDVRVLDLKDDDGRAALDDLLATADLLLTSSQPGALARLGLGWSELSARFPRLCQVAIVGHLAPDDDVAGHDLTYQAVTGTLTPPTMPTVLIADLAGAERAVSEGLAALICRDTNGSTSYREVALSAICEDLAQPIRHGLTTPAGVLGGALPAYGLYATASGHLALAALEPHFRAQLLEVTDTDGSRNALEALFATRSAQEWGTEHDIPIAAVRAPVDH